MSTLLRFALIGGVSALVLGSLLRRPGAHRHHHRHHGGVVGGGARGGRR